MPLQMPRTPRAHRPTLSQSFRGDGMDSADAVEGLNGKRNRR